MRSQRRSSGINNADLNKQVYMGNNDQQQYAHLTECCLSQFVPIIENPIIGMLIFNFAIELAVNYVILIWKCVTLSEINGLTFVWRKSCHN